MNKQTLPLDGTLNDTMLTSLIQNTVFGNDREFYNDSVRKTVYTKLLEATDDFLALINSHAFSDNYDENDPYDDYAFHVVTARDKFIKTFDDLIQGNLNQKDLVIHIVAYWTSLLNRLENSAELLSDKTFYNIVLDMNLQILKKANADIDSI
ncbi:MULTISPECIES: hypothetical protein [unclassified Pedobacter]|uniref:hypothetical protein n=1 Tax=unclassified Pedobacter TaxID=2628915 RepID=UPI001D2EDD5D|nr:MULTISPECIES: hypothetical protein [unclassified Pedobacter]CAH0264052.1 hypothetical protein SRABI36_03546 [Pedobacter sp. Bi36]CAH0290575.1 hypothetical protein SRABI126_04040 [Pedobacter sp. Bi126]